ncbi:hypothetical protein Q7I30_11220 [Aeromonas veronii]
MPTLRLSLGDATSIIPFSGQIKERDEMEMLRRYLDEALGNVFDRLEKQLDKGINQVLAQLEALQTSLKEVLTRNLRSELEQVRQGLQHKEQELADYDELLTRLSTI